MHRNTSHTYRLVCLLACVAYLTGKGALAKRRCGSGVRAADPDYDARLEAKQSVVFMAVRGREPDKDRQKRVAYRGSKSRRYAHEVVQ